MSMHTMTKMSTINGIAVPNYRTVRGSSSIESFHSALPGMIPGWFLHLFSIYLFLSKCNTACCCEFYLYGLDLVLLAGPHCAARPYQVYLLSGIARWNSDRKAGSVFGMKGRNMLVYSSKLLDRVNNRCKKLFKMEVEENFQKPAENEENNELLGLEYLFNQSTSKLNYLPFYAHSIIYFIVFCSCYIECWNFVCV